uniref:Cytochrome b5 heme-binding domain-containing protein n=1 Tax=Trichobilharzia regenti TaxID=157069 RepID=A0AA85IX32_TRIRE|nr:unnamed protein product [Trichobilharzia regenti]
MANKTPCSISLDLLVDKKELQSRLKNSMGIGHWNAYTRSEKYLSEQPTNREIDCAELAKHAQLDDMWIALNNQGKSVVYDITKFAAYHPGGCDILLEHAGTDASEAFRIAHSYVSPNMISRLQKGYLVPSPPGRSHMPNQLSPFSIPSTFRLNNSKKPIWDWKEFDDHVELFIDYANNNNNNKVFSNNFNHELDSLRILSTWSPVDTLSTKDSSGTLMLRTFLDIEYHCLELNLRRQLRPDLSTLRMNRTQAVNSKSSSSSSSSSVQLRINLIKMSSSAIGITSSYSSSSLSVSLAAPSSSASSSSHSQPDISNLKLVEPIGKNRLMSTIGIILRDVLVELNDEHSTVSNEIFFACKVMKSFRLENNNNNNKCYRFLSIQWPDNHVNISIPIGHHVNVRLKDDQGNYVIRPYTAVCEDLTFSMNNDAEKEQKTKNQLFLLIKIYPNGEFTSLVDKITEDDVIDVSLPMGNFNINLIKQIIDPNNSTCSYLIMLAAGSGITPMLRILHFLFINNNNNNRDIGTFKVHLIYFNRSQVDQILISNFQSLHNRFPDKFFITHVLSEPINSSEEVEANSNWIHGLISDELCCQSLGSEFTSNFTSNTTCLICGPSGFNDAAFELTEKWSIPKRSVHVFKG